VTFGDLHVPLDPDGHFLVNMCGDVHPYSIAGIFDSILKIKQGEVDHLLVDPYEFHDKIVFVGAVAAGLADLKATPLSTKTPGVVIHASAATNLLNHDFLRPSPAWATLLIAVTLAIATVFSILATSRIYLQLAIPVLIAGIYGSLAVWSFGQGLVLDMAAPFTAIGLGLFATAGFLVFTEGRDKRRVRAMFSQYVSPAVLEEVVDHYRNQLRAEVGTREHLSILFSDVRGFTSLSEKLQAEQVVDLLNIHFSVMGEIIFRYKGTLDKFIGDAIMAFWGAPIPVADHARQSVCAAIEMSRHMVHVNEQLAAKGYPPIDVGVGINTGDVVLGNIGSDRKLDYTVIGDHVNLGSRLEGLTKQYGCHIIISEYTYLELKGEIPCAVVDLVRVKGKQVPIRIYWPLALPSDPPPDMATARTVAELSERAFAAYLARRFEEAGSLYAQLPEGHLRDLFMERCEAYRVQPPAETWDGVFNLTTK
jgi:adenylate cyclase